MKTDLSISSVPSGHLPLGAEEMELYGSILRLLLLLLSLVLFPQFEKYSEELILLWLRK
jgi:hypothetical protein